jgi:hypothetical protein
VYGKFTEGFDTSDLRVARATLEARGIVASKVSTTGDGASDVPVDLDAARVESGDRRRRR